MLLLLLLKAQLRKQTEKNSVEISYTHRNKTLQKKMPSTSGAIDKLSNQFDNDVNNGDVVPIFKRALLYGDKIAIKDYNGKYSYRQILDAAQKLSAKLSVYNNSEYLQILVFFACIIEISNEIYFFR